MLPEVDEFLETVATPEYRVVAVETMSVFDAYEYTEHEQELLNAAICGGDDEASAIQEIHYILLDHVSKVLAMHNLTISDDASLDLGTQILKGVQDMQFWEDKESLLRLLESDVDPEECFAALLEEVVGLQPNQVLDVLEDFDPGYLKRLTEVLTGGVPTQVDDEEDINAEQLIRLKNYNLFSGNSKLIGIRLVQLGYRIGAPFASYANKVKARMLTLDDEQFAQEIMVLLLLGRDTWTAPTQAWRDTNFLFELELPNVTAIDAKLKVIWSQFDRFSNQSVNPTA